MLGRVGQTFDRPQYREGSSMSGWKEKIRSSIRGISPFALLTSGSLIAGLLILYACQDNPELTAPSTASAAVAHTLTIIGSGTGTGTVTSVPSGINCRISLGAATGPVCSKSMSGTLILKAAPVAGHAFAGWTSGDPGCVGTEACKVDMTKADLKVTAKFNKGPFTIKLSSGTGGSGKVKLQVGTLIKTCTITNGAL